MCGIVGFLAKRDDVDVAANLVAMLQALRGRGPDSTGLSLYGAPFDGDLLASVWAGDDGGAHARDAVLEAVDRHGEGVSGDYHEGYFRIGLRPQGRPPDGLKALAGEGEGARPGAGGFSLG